MARPCGGVNSNICVAEGCYAESCTTEGAIFMTQSGSDNVYLSLTFGNIPRSVADKVREAAETAAGEYDVSVDYGDPIGDQPTPVFEETADAVGSTPVVNTDAPVVPDADPTPAPVMTATDDTPAPSN